MSLDPYQAQLGDLVMGAGTRYQNSAHPTGLGVEDIRAADVAIPYGPGIIAKGDHVAKRDVQLRFHILDDDGATRDPALVEQRLQALRAAWAPVTQDVALHLRVADEERILYGRPRGCIADLRKITQGRIMATCRFTGTDPYWYAVDELSADAALVEASGGLSFPATAPFTFGAGSTGNVIIATNPGTAPAPWTATLTGPITNPRVVNESTGALLELSAGGGLDLLVGQTLELDSAQRSILLNGEASRYDRLSRASRWWSLPPESSTTFRLAGLAGSGAMTVRWRGAYL